MNCLRAKKSSGILALGVVLLWSVSCAYADEFRSAHELVDTVGKTGIALDELVQALNSHGVHLVPTGDAQGRLRAKEVSLGNGLRLTSIVLLPDSAVLQGQLYVKVDSSTCLPVEDVSAHYGLKDTPIVVTAPAPSSTPSQGKPLTAVLARGQLGKVTLGITYWLHEGKSSADSCVDALIFN